MRLGFRGKLILVSIALIVVVGLFSMTYLEVRLRAVLVENVEEELRRHAVSYGASVSLLELDDGEADRLAKAVGRDQALRLSVIAPDGRVLADSDVSHDELSLLDNHAQRPEVAAALEGTPSVSHRYSDTVDTDMVYVAVPLTRHGLVHVVRAAMPLAQVDALIVSLRATLAFAGIIGLFLAAFMSSLASHLVTRTLRDLTRRARRLSAGKEVPRENETQDEVQLLAGSLDRLAEDAHASVEALAEERDRFSSILEAMQDGVLAVDEGGRVILANPAAIERLSLDDTPVGSPLAAAIDKRELLEAVAGGDAGGELEMELGGATPRRVVARVSRLRGSAGAVVVLHDVTDIRRLESVRSDFVANVSHELRTPVTIIRANAEALQDGALDDKVRGPAFVNALHRNAERLSQLVSDLLDLARIESGRYVPRVGRVTLASLAEGAVRSLEDKWRERGHDVVIDVPADLAVAADAGALEQVLVNLIENAVKYTPPGGHLEVRARAAQGRVRLEVSDDGPGISPEHRARVFERFYRVDAGRSREMGGTGLGLSIVKHLVLAMGGQVALTGNQPKGSVFSVELSEALDRAEPQSHDVALGDEGPAALTSQKTS